MKPSERSLIVYVDEITTKGDDQKGTDELKGLPTTLVSYGGLVKIAKYIRL